MKKLLFLIPFILYAKNIYLDFSICYEKYKNIYNTIQVTNQYAITFSKIKKYSFFDPFTKMYIIKKNRSKILFSKNPKLGWFMSAINYEQVYGGTFAKNMLFFNLAQLSVKTPKNTIISDIFCRAYGVGRGDGFITYDYIKHFIDYRYWGDIGIEVDKWMRVKYIDPFYVKGINVGDKILMINNKKANPQTFKKFILFGKKGNVVVLKTNKNTIAIKIRKKIYNFTPLYHFGIEVNDKLYVIKLPKKIINTTFIKLPAKLVAINNKKINSFEELKKLLSFYKNVTITLQKNGIKINIPLRQ